MEITYEEAQRELKKEIDQHPEMRDVAFDAELDTKLLEILDYLEIDRSYLEIVKFELMIVLALYAPLNELPQNIAESVGMSEEKAERLVTLIETLVLGDLYGQLLTVQYVWYEKLREEGVVPKAEAGVKEELELRPQGVPRPEPQKRAEEVPKPLTREDVLSALASRRTMASDIESVKKSEENKDE